MGQVQENRRVHSVRLLHVRPVQGEITLASPIVPTHHFQIDWSLNTILRLIEEYDFETVLDIGSGAGEHTRFFRHYGKQVFSVDLDEGADYVGDFNELMLDRQFDVVWCSHVLEHQRNVG